MRRSLLPLIGKYIFPITISIILWLAYIEPWYGPIQAEGFFFIYLPMVLGLSWVQNRIVDAFSRSSETKSKTENQARMVRVGENKINQQENKLEDGEYVVRDGKTYRLTPIDDEEEEES